MPDDLEAVAAELFRLIRHFRRELWFLEHPFPEIAALLQTTDSSLADLQLPLPLIDQAPFVALADFDASRQPHDQLEEAQHAPREPLPGRHVAQPPVAALEPTAALHATQRTPAVAPLIGPVFSLRGLVSEKPGPPGHKPVLPGDSLGNPVLSTAGSQALPGSESQTTSHAPSPEASASAFLQPPGNPVQVTQARGLDLVASLVESIQENSMRRDSTGSVPVGHTAYQPGTPLLSSKTPDPMAQGPGSPPGYWRPGSQAVHESGRLPDQVIQVYPQAAQHGPLSAQSPPLVQGSPGAPVQFELQPGVSHQAAAPLQPSLMGDAGSPPIAALDRHSAHGPIATAGIDPEQLVELVNQALVEQARRYGVDIS